MKLDIVLRAKREALEHLSEEGSDPPRPASPGRTGSEGDGSGAGFPLALRSVACGFKLSLSSFLLSLTVLES